ncbi:MAG TPA: cytochrome c oxidase subunit II [Rhodocyclaceae bacterium]|nr:cytochrome c oxidase subunit II [Rhodocyclaceae bacterium]
MENVVLRISVRGWLRGLLLLLLHAALPAWADYAINLQNPATVVAREVYHLHNVILLVCLGIFVVVFVPMFYALWRHRKSVGHVADVFHEHTGLELAWTVVPALILVGMAIPATSLILDMRNTASPDTTIKVTGRQWKWEYEYLADAQGQGQGVRFISNLATPEDQTHNRAAKGDNYLLEVDQPLVVPVGRKVRLVITAEDVIHSWWVPAFGVKQDGIPGFIRDVWIQVDHPGTYRGQCAELCGVGHGFMPIVVEARSPEEFNQWLAGRKAQQAAAQASAAKDYSLAELVGMGEKVFKNNCVACHQTNGKGLPGAFPALDGSALVNGPKAGHMDRVFNGKPGTAMAAFGKQLSDVDIAAVITYERNSWGNKTGDAVQPREIAALRK